MPNKYLPVNISLKDRTCLVVGGGKVALRKIENLLDYDANLTVIAPELDKRIEFYAEKGKLKLEKRKYQSPEGATYGLVISASDDNAVNEQVSKDCRKAGVPVNVVDNPTLCDVIFPAVIKRDCLSIAVSTDGKAPFMSGYLRLILEDVFPERWSRIARLAATFRKKVGQRWPGEPTRRADCFNSFLNTDWKTLLDEKNDRELEEELDRLLENPITGTDAE